MLSLLLDAKELDKKVRDVMTHQVMTFNEEDSLVIICKFLMKNYVRRVPIVNDDKLVGVLSRRDMISEILRIRDEVVAT